MRRLLCLLSVFSVLFFNFSFVTKAETIYEYNGYSYKYLDNGMASICGWDNSSSDFVVPDKVLDTFVLEIDRKGMQRNSFIKSVDFSKATKFLTIGGYAFENCTSIAGTLTLPRKIGFIGDSAFMNCSSLESVNYNANTDTVSRQCFKNCSSLKDVEINAGASEIEAYAFQNCIGLETVTISKTIKKINSTAFNGCPKFTIKGYRDSYAQQFAQDNGYDFYILDPLLGDTTGDGDVDIMDATYIQKYKIGAQGYDLTEYQRRCADVNRDGNVTVRDATLIQMKLAKYDVDF